ncbi:MAG TPA: hypothetical protein VJ787_04685 [Thermoleophilia bacterium]|nr:hypothetical protein [Thermoleophilia bacterium]
MPDPKEQKAGTPGQAEDDGDAAATQTAGTPGAAADDGDAAGETPEQELQRLRNERRLSLDWKAKAERVNELEEEVTRLRSAAPSPATQANGQTNDSYSAADTALANHVIRLRLEAAAGDERALAELALLQRNEQQAQFMREQFMLAQVPEAKREAVRAGYERNRGRFADPLAYFKAMLGDEYVTKQAELEKREAELDARTKARIDGQVGTVTRPVPAKEVQASRMTMNEFTIQYDRLMSEGKRDEAFALSKKVADKEIKFSR